jgi:hypothetical protein
MSFHSATELTNNSGDDKTDKTNVSQKDLYKLCVGASPTKTQGIWLRLDNGTALSGACTTPPISGTIEAFDTQPGTKMASVGTITFGDPLIQNTKNKGATVTSIKLPATVNINCTSSLGTTTAELNGILNLSYKEFTKGAPVCPISGSIKITGSATAPVSGSPVDFVIDDGSNVKINKRAGGVTLP